MSCFRREHLQIRTYMEVLRKHKVRRIGMSDGIDALHGNDEFTPFRNIMQHNILKNVGS